MVGRKLSDESRKRKLIEEIFMRKPVRFQHWDSGDLFILPGEVEAVRSTNNEARNAHIYLYSGRSFLVMETVEEALEKLDWRCNDGEDAQIQIEISA